MPQKRKETWSGVQVKWSQVIALTFLCFLSLSWFYIWNISSEKLRDNRCLNIKVGWVVLIIIKTKSYDWWLSVLATSKYNVVFMYNIRVKIFPWPQKVTWITESIFIWYSILKVLGEVNIYWGLYAISLLVHFIAFHCNPWILVAPKHI